MLLVTQTMTEYPKIHNKYNTCTKHLPNMAGYPQQHLKIPQTPIAGLAIDIIGHLPITSKDNRWALAAICLFMSFIFQFK